MPNSAMSTGGKLRAVTGGYGWWALVAIPIFGLASYITVVKASAGFVTGAGMFLSLLGVLVSIFGFVVAISQILAARTETEKVSEAMASIKRQFYSLEIAAELRSCRAAVEEAIGHIVDKNWPRAVNSCNGARISLVKIASLKTSSVEIDVELAKDFAAQMLDGCGVIEKLKVEKPEDIPSEAMIVSLRKLEEFLIESEYMQKDGVNG